MDNPYRDLEDDNPYYRMRSPTNHNCTICDNTGEVTAIHRVTGSIYEFMCSCPRGFLRYKNHDKCPEKIAPEWEKATWKEGRMKCFVKYDPSLLPTLGRGVSYHNNQEGVTE